MTDIIRQIAACDAWVIAILILIGGIIVVAFIVSVLAVLIRG
jgi:hypothetical protein